MCAFQRPNASSSSSGAYSPQHMSIRVDPRAELDEQVETLGRSVRSLKFMATSISEEAALQGTILAQLVRLFFFCLFV